MDKVKYEAPKVENSEIKVKNDIHASGSEYNDKCTNGCCFSGDDKYQESW